MPLVCAKDPGMTWDLAMQSPGRLGAAVAGIPVTSSAVLAGEWLGSS
jgi:hypothetical protein